MSEATLAILVVDALERDVDVLLLRRDRRDALGYSYTMNGFDVGSRATKRARTARTAVLAMMAIVATLVAAGCGGAQIGTVSDDPTRRVPVTVETGCGGEPSDSITIEGVALRGHTLLIDVAHGGGCEEHSYRVCAGEQILDTDPGQWPFTVLHDAHGDDCRAEEFRVLEAPVETTDNLIGLRDAIDGRSFTVLVR